MHVWKDVLNSSCRYRDWALGKCSRIRVEVQVRKQSTTANLTGKDRWFISLV